MRVSLLARSIVLCLVALVLASCNSRDESAEQPASTIGTSHPLALTTEEISHAGIKLEAVSMQNMGESITLTGTIVPNQTRIAKIAPALPGRVTEVRVVQGEHVKSGQALAVLQSIELGEAQAAYRQAKSDASLADAALARAEQLTVEDIIPRKDYLRAETDAERAQVTLAAAADKLRLLGVTPVANSDRQRDAVYPLIAPFAGTVIQQQAVRGELAQPDQSLFTVADLSTVWVEADVFEKDLAMLASGMPARITVAAYLDREFEGTLTYLANTMDTATRTVKARIVVPNHETRLKPGMFASVMLTSSAVTDQALLVPEVAVTLIQGQTAVFVKGDTDFDVRAVETEAVGGGQVRITAGLKAGEVIVVSGIYELKARLLKSQIGSDD